MIPLWSLWWCISLTIIIIVGTAGWSVSAAKSEIRHPIILVPGDGGTQIWAKLNRRAVPHYLCQKKSEEFFDLWLNLEYLVPVAFDCWVENIRLVYDNVTRKTSNSEGVTTQIPDWGNTSSVEWLDPSQVSVSQYYNIMVTAAVSWGYKRGKDIRAAPYDFRLAPNEMDEYYSKLKELIEDTYYLNNNRRVLIVAHSMGNPTLLVFYQRQSQKWKNKFIKAHISLGAPWGGSVKIMKLFASGYNLDRRWASYFLPPLKMRIFQRTMPSSAFLLPNPKFWPADETLVETAVFNYTSADYQQFFADIGYPTGWEMLQDTRNLVNDEPPNVELHCLVGSSVSTAARYVYTKLEDFPDKPPKEVYGDGDGTVPMRSLKGCQQWIGRQKKSVIYKELPLREHLFMLEDNEVIEYVKSLAIVEV